GLPNLFSVIPESREVARLGSDDDA
ncbi:MAG: hypothetical protein JWO45_2045, partial [Spartobacteria bacterium]|nr:hypothetical protein [Spartobacteria bacterium]